MLTGIAAGLAAGALWGLVFVVPRITPGLSAIDVTAGRFASFGAVSALAVLVTLKSRRLPNLSQALAALGMSVLGFTGYYLVMALSIIDAGTEVPTLIIGTIPLWMMLLGKPQALRWPALLPGMLLTALGLALMTQASWQAASGLNGGAMFWRGVGLAMLAMVSWTVFGLLNAAWLKAHPDVSATTWANWLGIATGLGALLLWILAGTPLKTLQVLDNKAWLAIVCITTGVASAWVSTILWNVASQRLSASLCGQLIVSETIFALVYSYAWDGQWPSALQLSASLLFVLGIWFSVRAHR